MTCFVDSHGRSSPFFMEEKQMGEVDGRRGQGTGKEEEGETGWCVKEMRKIN